MFQAIRKRMRIDRRSVKTSVLFHIAWKNFSSKKLRSFLTVFGVVIGVSAIFFLLSFGLGIQQLVTTQVVGDKSLKAIDIATPNSKILKINEDVINDIKTYPHVEKVGVQYSFPGIVGLGGGEVDTVVFGLDQNYLELSNLSLTNGRLLQSDDNRSILVNQAALKAVGIDNFSSAVGQEITVNIPLDEVEAREKSITGSFTIVGVIDSSTGSEIYVQSGLFDVAGVPTYSQAKVVVDDMVNVDAARKQIEANGLQTTSLTDTLTEIDNIFKFFNLILIGFGSIGMLVAILGMFNTLTISLLERTKEIGLMIALGARRKDMRKLFIFEAGLISFVGSVIGLVFAFVVGKVVNIVVNLSAQSRGVTQWLELFATPLWSVVAIIAGTLLVGLIVVYIPAKRAERINPIDALRRE